MPTVEIYAFHGDLSEDDFNDAASAVNFSGSPSSREKSCAAFELVKSLADSVRATREAREENNALKPEIQRLNDNLAGLREIEGRYLLRGINKDCVILKFLASKRNICTLSMITRHLKAKLLEAEQSGGNQEFTGSATSANTRKTLRKLITLRFVEQVERGIYQIIPAGIAYLHAATEFAAALKDH